jgi:thiol-disulfide isomerase/thioredoxin
MRVSLVSAVFALAVFAAPAAQRLIYPPSDPSADIASALAAASADGSHVIVDFGADWCPDCRVLARLFEDPAVAPYLEENFHVVHVDVGRRDKHLDAVARYGATAGDWIPAIVVLDAAGRTIARTDERVRFTRTDTPASVLAILKTWAPKRTVAALGGFVEHGVRVALTLDRDSQGEAFIAATFTPLAEGAHLYATDLPDGGIEGLGRPTRLAVRDSAAVRARGRAVADRASTLDRIEALDVSIPVYPPGPVTLRVPVALAGGGPARLVVGYMACGNRGCLPPVSGRGVDVTLPAPGTYNHRQRGTAF